MDTTELDLECTACRTPLRGGLCPRCVPDDPDGVMPRGTMWCVCDRHERDLPPDALCAACAATAALLAERDAMRAGIEALAKRADHDANSAKLPSYDWDYVRRYQLTVRDELRKLLANGGT